MEIALGVTVIGIICFLVGLAPFESTLALLLLTPIVAFPLAQVIGPGPVPYYVAFALLFVVLLILSRSHRRKFGAGGSLTPLIPLALFIVSFSLYSYLCHLWPDFYQLGERLRDFAVLASTLRSPIEAREPWMAGAPLSYYLYWYRFGHFLSVVFQLPPWEVYHQLQSFTFALYSSAIFVLFRNFLGLPGWAAFGAAAAISVGSNVEGIRHFLRADDNWWGPSRVIPGAINEFPAWSFLLGDAHPHYLNLGLPPFLLLLFLRLTSLSIGAALRLTGIAAILIVGTLWIYNANAWEVPVWVGLAAIFFVLFLCSTAPQKISGFIRENLKAADFSSFPVLLLLLLAVYVCFSLASSALNIVPAPMDLKLVPGSIARTSALELLRHWGIPLGIVYVASLVRLNKPEWYVAGAFALASALFSGSALVLLAIVLALTIYRLVQIEFRGRQSLTPMDLAFESMGLVAMLLIIFPEIAFFDDSYGGENERMNTIFKAYSAAWFLLHGFGFYLLSRLPWKPVELTLNSPWTAAVLVIATLWTGFFFRTIKLRKNPDPTILPYSQGLSDVERRFPGSATAIQVLLNSRPGVVLEAQGPAYDFTTLVATLSGQPAYLGWANHVNLLLRRYDEVNRRTEMTNRIYQEPDCTKKLQLTAQEGIKYVVLGALEKKAYPGIGAESFSCFQTVVKAKEYLVFAN